MTFERLLFDSSGTISRKEFWLAHLLLFPLEIGAAFLFRIRDNYLCSMNPAEPMGQVYYGALGTMVLVFFFMWYCVVIKRLRALGRGHISFLSMPFPFWPPCQFWPHISRFPARSPLRGGWSI